MYVTTLHKYKMKIKKKIKHLKITLLLRSLGLARHRQKVSMTELIFFLI